MRSPRRLPRESFRLSAVLDDLDVSHRLRDQQAAHVAFAIALTEVDRHLDDQAAKRDVEAAIVQAWDYFASERNQDVVVTQHRAGLETDVIEEPPSRSR